MSRSANLDSESFLSKKLTWGFRRYVRKFIRKNFNAVRIANSRALPVAIEGPLICFVNHPSWWDPMTAVLITDHFFTDRRFQAPMDATAIKNYPIFQRLGFFPLDRETQGGLRDFLRTCRKLLANSRTILWVAPTGRFADIREQAAFMGGLGHISGFDQQIVLLPIAVEYTFWNERFPELLIEFGPLIRSADLPESKSERTATFARSLAKAQESLAEKAIARNPDAFVTISMGQSGIGGFYDFLRRIAAFLKGDRFHGRHDSTTKVSSELPEGHFP